jgi:hypothetical protein
MFIYLASPYTNNPHENFKKAEEYVAEELKKGVCIFSPIVHCHEIAQKHSLPHDFDFWKKYNFGMLQAANELHVLMLPDWKKSIGVLSEIEFAQLYNIPVKLIEFIGLSSND